MMQVLYLTVVPAVVAPGQIIMVFLQLDTRVSAFTLTADALTIQQLFQTLLLCQETGDVRRPPHQLQLYTFYCSLFNSHSYLIPGFIFNVSKS